MTTYFDDALRVMHIVPDGERADQTTIDLARSNGRMRLGDHFGDYACGKCGAHLVEGVPPIGFTRPGEDCPIPHEYIERPPFLVRCYRCRRYNAFPGSGIGHAADWRRR